MHLQQNKNKKQKQKCCVGFQDYYKIEMALAELINYT